MLGRKNRYIPHYLVLMFIFVNLSANSQEVELLHTISSNQTYTLNLQGDKKISIFLNYYSPGIIDYSVDPYFFVKGWIQLVENKKKNIDGIYRPYNDLVLYVSSDTNFVQIKNADDFKLNIDTTNYTETFYFPSFNNKKNRNAIWYSGDKGLIINNIDFDKKNVFHNIVIKIKSLSYEKKHSIDITDLVISPFGDNNIFLEDYNVNIHSTSSDSSGNLHVLLSITNEYVIPSSSSTGGYYYIMLDKNFIIRKNIYFETYNQGRFISFIDDKYKHPLKERYLIVADWSDSKVIGSFLIENSKITIENEWRYL
jgi:hypothetical protein